MPARKPPDGTPSHNSSASKLLSNLGNSERVACQVAGVSRHSYYEFK